MLIKFSKSFYCSLLSRSGAFTPQKLIRNMSSSKQDRPSVYVTRRVPQRGIELLSEHCNITQWNKDDPIPRDELLKNVPGKDALFCLLTEKIDDEVLEAAGPSLKVIGTMSVGYDHVDVGACRKRNIPVGHTPDVLTDAVAELTMALLLATARRIHEGIDAVKTGKWGTWAPLWLCGPTLTGSTVGIVGMGRIGYEVTKRLKPFGVKKILSVERKKNDIANDLGVDYVSFDELLEQSDFVLLTCSLTPETKEMMNKAAFSKMKSSAVLINTSRGGVVNQDDLYEALTTGQIRAAGLDVTTPEPLPPSDRLAQLSNCLILPHIASATDETRSQMSELTAKNILAVLEGKEMPAEVK